MGFTNCGMHWVPEEKRKSHRLERIASSYEAASKKYYMPVEDVDVRM